LTKGGQKEYKVENINLRLKSLINSAPMLFMKGSKSEPKCKFSTAIVNLLKEICAEFSTFDILEDQVVREKLKTFSNWPTYPQVNLLKCLNYAILLNKKTCVCKALYQW